MLDERLAGLQWVGKVLNNRKTGLYLTDSADSWNECCKYVMNPLSTRFVRVLIFLRDTSFYFRQPPKKNLVNFLWLICLWYIYAIRLTLKYKNYVKINLKITKSDKLLEYGSGQHRKANVIFWNDKTTE